MQKKRSHLCEMKNVLLLEKHSPEPVKKVPGNEDMKINLARTS
jgi:hypothetical protein